MTSAELQDRTRRFALDAIRFVSALPKNRASDVLGRQLLRSATSIGANHREAVHAESRADFKHKMNLVEKDAAETVYWLELCQDSSTGRSPDLDPESDIGTHHQGTKVQRWSGQGLSLYAWRSWRLGGSISGLGLEVLLDEFLELLAIFTAVCRTAKRRP
jgi:four helix bundle protein